MAAPTPDPMTAFCVLLREALEWLVDGVEALNDTPPGLQALARMDIAWRLANAQAVLRMETGRHARADLEVTQQLAEQAYTLADYVHATFYGTPRSPQGGIPTRAEVETALQTIATLTQQSWALEALLAHREEARDA